MRNHKFCKSLFLAAFLLAGIISQNKAFAQVEANYSTAKFKNWVSFRGQQGEFVQFPNSPFWKPEPNLTLECWTRLNQPVPAIFQHIFGNCWNPNGSNFNSDWGFGFSLVNNRFGFHVIINGINQFETSNATDTLSACKWYHIAGVKEGQQARIYVNGILRAETTLPSGPIRVSNGPANLGTNYATGYNNWFDGNIDEFRLWNFARTQAQIQSKMNDTLLGNEAGLQAYYKFNETGQGNGIVVTNSAQASGSQLNGLTISPNSNFPKLVNSEVLPFPPPPTVPQQQSFCFPGSIFNLFVNQPSGSTIKRYNWYNSPGQDTVFIPEVRGTQFTTPFLSQTDTFYVSTVNNLGCESPKVSVMATVYPKPPPPQISSNPFPACFGKSVTVTAAANNSSGYNWFKGFSGIVPLPGQNEDTLHIQNPNDGDTIWVNYQGLPGNCTSDKVSTILSIVPPLSAPEIFANPNPFCPGSDITLSTQVPISSKYYWFKSDGGMKLIDSTLSSQLILNQHTKIDTIWLLYQTFSGGCKSLFGKVVLIPSEKPTFSITSQLVCPGEKSLFTVIGSNSWRLEMYSDSVLSQLVLNGVTNSEIYSPVLEGRKKFWLKLSPSQGVCPSQVISHEFKVKEGSIGIGDTFCVQIPEPIIPNLITPNGDNSNDRFEIKNLKYFEPSEIQIFNRWGKEVFTQSPYQNEWTGENGIYFYKLKLNQKQFTGFVQVESK
jgi:gliding motility-associated-like protein